MQLFKRFFALPKLVSILITCAVVAGLVYYFWNNNKSQSGKATQQIPTVIVEAAKIGAAVEGFEAIGTAKAIESIAVSAKISGYVQKIWAESGKNVEENAPIITLQAQERQADSDNFAAQLKQAEAKLADMQRIYARSKALIANEFTSRAAFETAGANLATAQAAVNALKAQQASAQSRLEDSIIRAPFAGVVGITDAQVGSYITAGTRLTSLTNMNMMKVELSLPERASMMVKKGMAANISPIFNKNLVIKGEISEVDTEINTATRQIRVNMLVPNEKRELASGLSVSAKIEAVVRPNALLLPETAVIGDGLRHFVFVLDANDKVQRKMITLGVRTSGTVEVLTGIVQGERVVVEGHQKIRHGQQVKVQGKN